MIEGNPPTLPWKPNIPKPNPCEEQREQPWTKTQLQVRGAIPPWRRDSRRVAWRKRGGALTKGGAAGAGAGEGAEEGPEDVAGCWEAGATTP